MKIQIDKLITTTPPVVVTFISDWGSASAIWAGETPVEKKYYEVELEIDNALTWGVDIFESDAEIRIENSKNNSLCIVARVTASEDDGCIALNLGNSIFLVEVVAAPTHLPKLVQLETSSAKLYPVNI